MFVCAIFCFSSVFFWDTLSSTRVSVSFGKVSRLFQAKFPQPYQAGSQVGASALAEDKKVALRSDWSMKGWTKGPVTLQQAFGITKGTVKFPPLQATLPSQVSQSQQQSRGGPGARGGPVTAPGSAQLESNQDLGQTMVTAAFGANQWPAFNSIVMAESGWDTTISNGGSHGYQPGKAYGIPQALPGSKMAAAGANWQTSAATQIKWMIEYIRSTYGTPQNAWAFHLANGWY